jgi:hypothetical protein
MDHTDFTPTSTDPSLRLPPATYYQILHTLRGLLPPPVTDTPEDHARRDDAAIAQVAAMLPVNADEAHLAAQCVAARAHAADCLRLARQHEPDTACFVRYTAQAARMTREANSSRGLLLRLQTERRKRETDRAAADSAAWTEHCAIGWMTQAATGAPPEPMPPPPPAAAAAEPEGGPARDPAAEAESYVAIDPDRAEPIRAPGRVPEGVRIELPDAALEREIVSGRARALVEADRVWAGRVVERDAVAARGD